MPAGRADAEVIVNNETHDTEINSPSGAPSSYTSGWFALDEPLDYVDGSAYVAFYYEYKSGTINSIRISGQCSFNGSTATAQFFGDGVSLLFSGMNNGDVYYIATSTTMINSGPCDGATYANITINTNPGNDNADFSTYGNSLSEPFLILSTTEIPDEPTTEFAEVLSYIPETGFSTSTGTTTIGANFSVPNPEVVSYVGYRLYSPSSVVLYEATTSTAIEGLYQIQFDYNFTDSGVYQGHAFFAQDYEGTIWEVDNPTVQQILVDVEEWTITPGGQFVNNQSTTSTSTLSSLTLDCSELGWASSVCNLVATIFIPRPTSIQLVQSSWSSVLNKAPFSFFTESKRVLDSFKGTNSSGGTLSLSFYGETADIISTTTAAAVGFTSTSLTFVKTLIAVGLWLLLAWYLYWRIASIFGV